MVVGRRDSENISKSKRRKPQLQKKETIQIPRVSTVREKEITSRIQSGNKCLYGLAKLLGSRSLSKELNKQ